MAKRKALSKKTRFEVFKRDRFTCQYCGAKAPDAVLHCDHVKPVAAGGENDILNLVTACQSCNSGKGARRLDDRSSVEKQRAQIEELEQRREQLEMMLKWRDDNERERVDVVDEIAARILERGGFGPNEHGKSNIRRWLRRYEAAELLAALDESFDIYMAWNGNEADQDAWEVAFKKIPVVAGYRRQAVAKPYMQSLAYIQGILRRRFDDRIGRYMNALEEYHVEHGIPLGIMERIAKTATDWSGFCQGVNEYFDDYGGADGQD
jgi:DNA-binding transcriptional ArsR family regulator